MTTVFSMQQELKIQIIFDPVMLLLEIVQKEKRKKKLLAQ